MNIVDISAELQTKRFNNKLEIFQKHICLQIYICMYSRITVTKSPFGYMKQEMATFLVTEERFGHSVIAIFFRRMVVISWVIIQKQF